MLLARIISVEADQERTCRPPAAATFFYFINDVARPRSGLAQQHQQSNVSFLAGPFVCVPTASGLYIVYTLLASQVLFFFDDQ